ncbi:MAG: hypothetical protein K2M79_03190 [Muribaculaceae bacterium]|nr:hypothetical protein [Muribaculaceae bacterium]
MKQRYIFLTCCLLSLLSACRGASGGTDTSDSDSVAANTVIEVSQLPEDILISAMPTSEGVDSFYNALTAAPEKIASGFAQEVKELRTRGIGTHIPDEDIDFWISICSMTLSNGIGPNRIVGSFTPRRMMEWSIAVDRMLNAAGEDAPARLLAVPRLLHQHSPQFAAEAAWMLATFNFYQFVYENYTAVEALVTNMSNGPSETSAAVGYEELEARLLWLSAAAYAYAQQMMASDTSDDDASGRIGSVMAGIWLNQAWCAAAVKQVYRGHAVMEEVMDLRGGVPMEGTLGKLAPDQYSRWLDCAARLQTHLVTDAYIDLIHKGGPYTLGDDIWKMPLSDLILPE